MSLYALTNSLFVEGTFLGIAEGMRYSLEYDIHNCGHT